MTQAVSRLLTIAALTREDVAAAKARTPLPLLERAARGAGAPRNFRGALGAAGRLGLIAEIKVASPAAGKIAERVDPASLAARFAAGGAHALSIWTEARFFHGQAALLAAARAATALPVLRKDFILEPYQVFESRAMGADAVLLIAALLEPPLLGSLIRLAGELGMAAAVSVHREVDVDRALAAGAELILIHNRDVETFRVDLGTTIRFRRRIPPGPLVISESGIATPEDVRRLAPHVDAILVGSALMASGEPEAAIRALLAAGGDGRGA